MNECFPFGLAISPRLEKEAASRESAARLANKITACNGYHNAVKSAFGGLQPSPMPCISYQIAGEKILAVMDVREAADFYLASRGNAASAGSAKDVVDMQASFIKSYMTSWDECQCVLWCFVSLHFKFVSGFKFQVIFSMRNDH